MYLVTDYTEASGFVVYGLAEKANPEVIRYVGQTVSLTDRFKSHVRESRSPTTPVHHWMAKHGKQNILVYILSTYPDRAMLDEAEIFWIKTHGTLINTGKGGLNCTPGGQGYNAYGYRHSTSTKEAISLKVRGESARGAILTEAKVKEIRHLYFSRQNLQSELAIIYGVSRSTVAGIIQRRKWKHIPLAKEEIDFSGRRSEKAKLSERQVAEIRRRLSSGEKPSAIGDSLGVHRNTVRCVRDGKSYKSYN